MSFSLAAVDTALWDLRGRALGEPLWRLLGGYRPEVRAYAGNIDLNFPMEQLHDGVRRSLAAGYRSVKMRLGRPLLREDVERVAAVRELIGPDIELMTDANEAWRPDEAMRAFHALREFGLVWIEEPIRPDDFEGYARLRAQGGVPIAATKIAALVAPPGAHRHRYYGVLAAAARGGDGARSRRRRASADLCADPRRAPPACRGPVSVGHAAGAHP